MTASGRCVVLVVLMGGPIFLFARAGFAGGTTQEPKAVRSAAWSAVREDREEGRRLLVGQLRNALRRQQDLRERRESLVKDIAAAKVSARRVLGDIDAENRLLARRCEALEATARTATRESVPSLLLETEQLRADVERAWHERRDQRVQAERIAETLIRQDRELHDTFARLGDLDKEVTELASKLHLNRAMPPPPIQGEVLAATSPKAIEISAGSRDGLQEGDRLHVCTNDPTVERVGSVVVLRTTERTAVCASAGPPSPRRIWRGYRVFSEMPVRYSGVDGVVLASKGGLQDPARDAQGRHYQGRSRVLRVPIPRGRPVRGLEPFSSSVAPSRLRAPHVRTPPEVFPGSGKRFLSPWPGKLAGRGQAPFSRSRNAARCCCLPRRENKRGRGGREKGASPRPLPPARRDWPGFRH